MTICYFGAYDKTYSKDKINLDGLKKVGVNIVECNIKNHQLNLHQKFILPFHHSPSIYITFSEHLRAREGNLSFIVTPMTLFWLDIRVILMYLLPIYWQK